LLGYTEKEVGLMTVYKLMRLYDLYKEDYNFRAQGLIYKIPDKEKAADEWLPD